MTRLYEKMYYRQRNRNRIHELVFKAVEEVAESEGTRKSDIAAKLGVDRSQITRWLSGPSNWNIDTISDLLWAVGGEVEYRFCRFSDMHKTNEFHPAGEPRVLNQAFLLSSTDSKTSSVDANTFSIVSPTPPNMVSTSTLASTKVTTSND